MKMILLLTCAIAAAVVTLVITSVNAQNPKRDQCPATGETERAETEQSIALSEVPEDLLKIVRAVAPDFDIKEVERETEGDEVSYSFEGKSNGHPIEIEIEIGDEDEDDV